jgi:hypothetical protein
MPSLMVFGPGHTTGIDLGTNAFWRITLAATSPTEMGLVVTYPPGGSANKIALAKIELSIAKNSDEIENVAKSCLMMGTMDLDLARASEAMNLFKMHRNVQENNFKEASDRAADLVRAYWALRGWLESNTPGQFEHEINGWKIRGLP